ncbi:hypothetical protein M23134_07359 [Microscilla marina ATCC 23134]|uniref:Uncharacterized protein n=1 Tax=Microscilla marina ATCC 23134 TaxID=313606 RepID=A1ZEK0_MICM2|nr:hypothetical protein M23134_07359 [Microscilla marina ATCC 23134]
MYQRGLKETNAFPTRRECILYNLTALLKDVKPGRLILKKAIDK